MENMWDFASGSSANPYLIYTTLTTNATNTISLGNTVQSNGTVSLPRLSSVKPKDEEPIAWLRRRVDEVLWQPS